MVFVPILTVRKVNKDYERNEILNPPSLSSSIYWPSQKIKIMFHVFTRYVVCGLSLREQESTEFSVPEPGGKLGIFQVPGLI